MLLCRISVKKTVEGTINDAEIESIVLKLWNFTEEERVPYYNRLNKKRANMALAWYNENNPVSFSTTVNALLLPKTQTLFMHSPLLIQVFLSSASTGRLL